MSFFIISIVMMVSWVYTEVKIWHYKYVQFIIWQLYQFARAAITKYWYHKLSGLNNRNLFFHSSES